MNKYATFSPIHKDLAGWRIPTVSEELPLSRIEVEDEEEGIEWEVGGNPTLTVHHCLEEGFSKFLFEKCF